MAWPPTAKGPDDGPLDGGEMRGCALNSSFLVATLRPELFSFLANQPRGASDLGHRGSKIGFSPIAWRSTATTSDGLQKGTGTVSWYCRVVSMSAPLRLVGHQVQ